MSEPLESSALPGAPEAPNEPRSATPADVPAFSRPWEAHAFAIVVMLHERGMFTWNEWTQILSERIAAAQREGDPDLGDTYYAHWLRALETLVERKGLGSATELARWRDAWDNAACRTPHGQPIEIGSSDFDRH